LSLRAASRALKPLIERSHIALWRWLQDLAPLERLFRPRKVRCSLVDETMVKIHGEEAWVWVAYEPYQRRFLALDLCWTRSSLSAEHFLRRLVERYGRHPVYTDRAVWYPETCRSLHPPQAHHIQAQSPHRKGCPVPEGQDRRVRRPLPMQES